MKTRKSRQLVCQYVEKMKYTALEKYSKVFRDLLRRRHGIYALYRGKRLYYVGLASSMRGRLKHHLRDRHAGRWDRFSIYLTVGDEKLRELESLLLRVAEPMGNRQRGRFARGQDLKGMLRRRIKESRDEEIGEIFAPRENSDQEVAAETPASGVRATLAEFDSLAKPTTIRQRFKGRRHRARVRKDGQIRYRGRLYKSPSAASAAIRKRSTNGWTSWEFERSPGEWVPLDVLRRR